MFQNILTNKQIKLLDLLSEFSSRYYLVGGTAIALQIGHRRSIDFDLFSFSEIDYQNIVKTIRKLNYDVEYTFNQDTDELSVLVNSVRISFVFYPFQIDSDVWFKNIISMPRLNILGAMKAYALGRRSKWKDYVDLYFLLKDYLSLNDMLSIAKNLFRGGFNERLFREQLCYFDDVDRSETVEYMDSTSAPDDSEIERFLI